MAAAFVSLTTGAASRSVTVPAGTDRLLVAVALYTSSQAAQSATYNGVAMSVATTADGFAQIFYMLSPPVGSATLAVTGSSVDTVVAAHYTGILSFQTASVGTTASGSFSPNSSGLIVFGMEAASTSHTPVANTNERYDTGGGWYGDRIVSSSGAVTVGTTAATSPDFAGAIFLDGVNASGTPSAPVATVSGAANVVVAASGTPSARPPTVAGSVTGPFASGSVSAPHPTVAGAAGVVVSVSGTVAAPHPTTVGTARGPSVPLAIFTLQRAAGSSAVAEPTARFTAHRARGGSSED